MNKEELIKYFEFDDIIHRNPNSEPFIILAGYESWKPPKLKEIGLDSELIDFRSYMIDEASKDKAFVDFDYSDMGSFETGYFDKDASGKRIYVTGESLEHHSGLIVEPLYIERRWPGLNLYFYEPSQRIVLYLNLINEGDEWKNPYKNETVIRRIVKEEIVEGTKHTTRKIEIKLDYLKDYLSARNSGLFITKYARRSVLFSSPDEVPLKHEFRDVSNGRWSFFSSIDNPALGMLAKEMIVGESELRQKFWIEPFTQPRRWDAVRRSEFEGGVLFTLYDGTKKEYNVEAGHKDDYFKMISFHPSLLQIFLNRQHYDYEEYSRETLGLKFPDGETLHVAVNPSGQIQAWWGQIAKLSREHQEVLAPYSEPWKEKLSSKHDYIRTTINGEWPQSKPLREALQNLKSSINEYFTSRFGETFFNQDSSIRDLRRVYEPYEIEPSQLLDVMEQIDKWLFSEKRPDKIIEYYKLAEVIEDAANLPNIKSIASLKLLMKKFFGNDIAADKIHILKIIRELRHCKAHYKDLEKTLEKFEFTGKTPQQIYRLIITELEAFLEWLNDLCKEDKFVFNQP